jgi:hypothetical protein
MRSLSLVVLGSCVGLMGACASSPATDGSFAGSSSGTASSGSSSGGKGASSSGSGSSTSSSGGSGGSSSGSGGGSGGSSGSSGGGSGGSSGSSGSGSSSGGASSSGGPAGSVPTFGGCAIFPADNPWNTRIDDPAKYPVDPSSAAYVASIGSGTHLHPDWGDWSTNHYGIPWQVVPAGQSTVPMTFDYADESDPGPYPFPASALVEGGAGSGGDMHILVIEQGTCALYETWSSTFVGPGWHAGSGAKFDLGSNALRPDGWTSADAAGLPVLPGLVKVAEVQAGAVNHAIRFTAAKSQSGYIHPATHDAGSSGTTLPPMGLRMRLKASFDLSTFSGPSLVILTAMKRYGIILADNGSNWYISGDSDDTWTPLMDAIVGSFAKVTGADFEAVVTGTIQH